MSKASRSLLLALCVVGCSGGSVLWADVVVSHCGEPVLARTPVISAVDERGIVYVVDTEDIVLYRAQSGIVTRLGSLGIAGDNWSEPYSALAGAGFAGRMDAYGVDLYDVSDPNAPTFVASIDGARGAGDIREDGLMATVMEQTLSPPKLQLFQLGSGEPAALAEVDVAPGHTPGNVAFVEPDLLMLSMGGGDAELLQVWDVSEPSTPVLLGETEMRVEAAEVRREGSYVFFAGIALHVVDLGDPAAPEVVASAYGVDFDGPCCPPTDTPRDPASWIMGRSGRVWDISDPRAPRPAIDEVRPTSSVSLASSSPVGGVAVDGDTIVAVFNLGGVCTGRLPE